MVPLVPMPATSFNAAEYPRRGRQPAGERSAYVEVCERLREAIRSDEFPNGRLPTERVLGIRHRVSIGTVRKALDLLANEGVIIRRQGSGTYISRPVEVRPITGARRTHMLCYLSGTGTESSTGSFFNRLLIASQGEVESAGYVTVLAGSRGGKLPMPLLRQKVDGVLLAGTYQSRAGSESFGRDNIRENNDFVSRIVDLGLPVVAISNPTDCQSVYRIDVDCDRAMYDALSYLKQLGHRRVAVYGGPRAWPAFGQRIDAFLRQSAALGLDSGEHLVGAYSNWTHRDRAGAVDCVRRHLQALPGVTAAIAVSSSSLPVQEGVRAAGRRWPEEFCLVSFSDIPRAEISRQVFIDPDNAIGAGVSTLTMPIHEMARQAVRRLVGLLEGQRVRPEQHILRLPLEFIPATSIQSAHVNSHSGQTGASL